VIPGANPASRVSLAAGDEAYCLLHEVAGRRSRSATRYTVRGVARVRVEPIEGDAFRVVVVCASRGGRPGERLDYQRAALYAAKGDDECRAFGALVAFLWGDR
jgi:hypothetical protein